MHIERATVIVDDYDSAISFFGPVGCDPCRSKMYPTPHFGDRLPVGSGQNFQI